MVWLDPFDESRAMMRRMMRGLFAPWEFEFESEKRMRPALLDVEEKGNEILVTAELPGMDKKGIKVDVAANSVSIRAERKEEKEKKTKNYYYKERSYGGFYRSMTLPAEVDPKSVKAVYKDGVLYLSMKKAGVRKKSAVEVRIQ